MGLFKRHDDDHYVRFKLRERMMSVGDDYWIEDHQGHRAFKVNGKALHIRDTWHLEDAEGREVATIREKKLSVRNTITIEFGGRTATVKKALVGLHDRFNVEVERGGELKVHGSIADHKYKVERDGKVIAEVSKDWFRVRDTYGVEIREPRDTVLLLAVTVAVDALTHD
jgi:uncharacterized protein YxjI